MARFAPIHLEADTRLHRKHPDVLPSHRRCATCRQIKPLTTDYFYPCRSSHPWQLSSFDTRCKDCILEAAKARRLADKAKYSALSSKSQKAKRSAIKAAGGPEAYAAQQAALVQKLAAARTRKEQLAALRRGLRRKYGPRPDGIKLMIAERSRMYAERRWRSSEEPKEFRRPVQANSDLESIRARHRAELAQRDSERGSA
ncbi:hypothetical protein [Variovorax sp. YR566]|uniref:hypothetical protein n=1 Tax=Variovorax sp. YR566 TaxID=3450237 RepID=UPI003F7DDEF0